MDPSDWVPLCLLEIPGQAQGDSLGNKALSSAKTLQDTVMILIQL